MTADYPVFDGTQSCAGEDPERFHPDLGGHSEFAKRICKGDPATGKAPCAFLEPCLEYSLHHSVSGIWGGTSGHERRQMRKKRGIVPEPLSFGTGPTNSSTAKRMAKRGTPVPTIAAHLGLTTEAVYRILREAEMRVPQPRGSRGVAQRGECPDCGTEMLRTSLGRHRRGNCPAREDVAS